MTCSAGLLHQGARLLDIERIAGPVSSHWFCGDGATAPLPREERRGGSSLVASRDRDAFQLAPDATTILHPIKGGEMARVDPEGVRKRYDVDPAQAPDFIALRGDPSDKIPGARGIGAKTAAALLRRHGSLEDAIAGGRFTDQADELRLYKRLAAMDSDAPIPTLADQTPTWPLAAALAAEMELNRLSERLSELSASQRL